MRQAERDPAMATVLKMKCDPYESSNTPHHLRTARRDHLQIARPSSERRNWGVKTDQTNFSFTEICQDCFAGQTDCGCIGPAFRPAGQRSSVARGQTDWRLGFL